MRDKDAQLMMEALREWEVPTPQYDLEPPTGFVSYNGQGYKIAGRVCMDQLMVDFGDETPNIGDDVLFFGKKDLDHLPVESIAESIGSTTYVLLTAIKGRTKYILLKD